MPHQTQDVPTHHQGDALDITTTVTRSDGSTKDLTGAQAAEYLIKTDEATPDADADISKTLGAGVTLTDPANGVLLVEIETGETATIGPGDYHHRLRVTDADGDRVTVFTGTVGIEY